MRNFKGQVLVETAVVLPILLVLIFGIIDFAIAMMTQNTLTNVAGSGARVAVVTTPLNPETPAVLLSSSKSATAQTIQNSLTNLIPFSFYKNTIASSVTYKLERLDPASGTPLTGTVKAGDIVRVTLTWPNFPTITPFYKLLGSSNSLTLTGAASMRDERG